MKQIFLLAFFLFVPSVFGQTTSTANCGCNATLTKDIFSNVRTDKQQYAFLSRIDKETFDELKRGGGATISIPIVKGLIDASANYDEFRQKRERYFQEISYQSNSELEIRELQIVTSPIAYPYWAQCMSHCATNRTGPFAWKDREDENLVVMMVYYHAPPGGGSVRVNSQLDGGSTGAPAGSIFPLNQMISSNETLPVIIRRTPVTPSTPRRAVTAVVSAGGFAAEAIVSEWKNPELFNPIGSQYFGQFLTN